MYFPEFNVIRGDVRRGYGGTAIFIRHGIPVRGGSINYSSCEIKINNSWHRIYSVYVTHNTRDIVGAFSNLFPPQMFWLFLHSLTMLALALIWIVKHL